MTTSQPAHPHQLLSVTHAAERLDCSRGHIYGLIAAGELTAVDIKAKGTRPKTPVLASEIDALITGRARIAGTGRPGAPEQRPDLYAGVLRPEAQETYSTTEAAALAECSLSTLGEALRTGQLHGERRTPRGRWTIRHECLEAWRAGSLCPHAERAEVVSAR